MFIHRSGRSGRNGQLGNALIFLTNEEKAYAGFLQEHEQVQLKQWELKDLNDNNAEKLRENVQQLAIEDR